MPSTAVHLLVFDGFADWEPAYALAELRRSGGYAVRTVGYSRDPVASMGGLRVLPDMVLGAVEPSRIRLLILPGGDRWEQEEPDPSLVALIGKLDPGTQPVAAICGATVALGRADLFRGRRHTSNGLDYLIAQVPGYRSSAEYVDAPAVRDRGLITASGLAAVEFAREIFAELGVFSPEDLTLWYRLFRG